MKQLAPFSTLEQEARKMIASAESIALLPPTPANAKVARTMRLEIRPLRTAVEKRYAELKRPIINAGNALTEGRDTLLDLLKPMEAKLLAIEQHAEREALRIEDEKREARVAEITPFLDGPIFLDLGKMPDEEYMKVLANAKDLAQLRVERARKEAEAAAAQAKAEAEERERVAAENARLKKEAEEREAAAKAEREAAAAALAAAQDKSRQEALAAAKAREEEQAAFEAERKKERAAAEAKAKAEREKAEEAARVAAEKARKEREAIEDKAKKERDELHARLKKESDERDRKTAEEMAKREKLESDIAAKKAAEEKAKLEAALAQKAAAMAPEKEKLKALAKRVLELDIPEMTSDEGLAAATEIYAQVVKFAAYITKKSDAL